MAGTNVDAQTAADLETAARSGAAAAGRFSALPFGVLGVLGGAPIGVGASQYFGSQRNEVNAAVPLVGVAIIVSGLVLGEVSVRREAARVPVRLLTPEEAQEYQRAFSARAQRRLRDSVLVGTVLGIGIGVGIHTLSARRFGG
jgi:hypothetical protein